MWYLLSSAGIFISFTRLFYVRMSKHHVRPVKSQQALVKHCKKLIHSLGRYILDSDFK